VQILRPYQVAAAAAVWEAHDDFFNSVLIVMPTGCGKTTVLAQIVKEALRREWYVLVTAHRYEIVQQLYERIRSHCDLCPFTDIGIEMADTRAPGSARVICASVDTIVNPKRIPEFKAKVSLLIRDEAHRGACDTDRKIAEQCGVNEQRCFYLGCTATAKRYDKQSLYAFGEDGAPVRLKDKKGVEFDAKPADCIFEKLAYEYPLEDAIEDGWIVEPKGHTVKTVTDLRKVKKTAGDFNIGELSKAIDNATRTLEAIQGWKEAGADTRPTLAFCATVEHAHHSAELFRAAGYTAAAIDGTTEKMERHRTFADFAAGRLRVLCNVGIATEGVDLVNCGCVIHLRPTMSWGLFCQMTGRGVRPVLSLPNEWTASERRAAIAASDKPDLIVIDVVDITSGKDLCTTPSLLDLPAGLDLQGVGALEAKKLLEEFREVKDRVIGECPVTYEELKVRLEAVNLLMRSAVQSRDEWRVTPDGFQYNRVRPFYSINMEKDGDSFVLRVKHAQETICERRGKPGEDFTRYLESARKHGQEVIDAHFKANVTSRGTLARLTEKQQRVLRRRHTLPEIDAMPYAKAKALIGKYCEEYRQSNPDYFAA